MGGSIDLGPQANIFFEIAHVFEIFRLVITVFSSLIVFDYLLTVRQEVHHIWKAKWTLAKAAFLANRYWTLLVHVPITLNASWADISEARCKRIYWMQMYACILVFVPCQVILAIRVRAIWNNSRPVSALLYSLIFCYIVVGMAVPSRNVATWMPGIPGCIGGTRMGAYDWGWAVYVPAGVLELVSVCLVCSKIGHWRRQTGQTELLSRLARDSITYFAICCSLNVANIILYTSRQASAYRAILSIPTTAITSIVCSRIVLGMRADSESGQLTASLGSSNAQTASNLTTPSIKRITMPWKRTRHLDEGAIALNSPLPAAHTVFELPSYAHPAKEEGKGGNVWM